MDLTQYILPYPYEAYTRYNRGRKRFEEYKSEIRMWVLKNTLLLPNMHSYIENAFSYLQKSDNNMELKQWMMNHLSKIRYIGDFSGLMFGVEIDEENECVSMRFPINIEEGDIHLFPDYNSEEFLNMGHIERLEWMNEHCEFIPFRILYEHISINGDQSHKFSHIRRDEYVMEVLKPYLESSKFYPRDHIYYYIQHNPKTRQCYLKRDLDKSPKNYELPIVEEGDNNGVEN